MKPICHHQLRLRHDLLAALLGAAVAIATPVSLAQTSPKAAKYYEDALIRYEKKDMPGAIIQLKNALQIDNTQLPVHLLLGKALLRNGQVAAAEVALREALRLGVSRAEVVVPLGESYMAQGKHNEILERETFNPAGLPPGVQVQLHLLRSAVQLDLGDSIQALRSIEKAREIDDNNAEVWLAEMRMRIRARQFKEAQAAADKALALTPDSVQSQYQRGSILHVRGDLNGALQAYDKALATDRDHSEALVARAGIYMDRGRFADAAKDVARLMELAPEDPRAAYLKALLAERNGDSAQANAALKQVTELLDPVPLDYIRYRPQMLMLNALAHFGLNQAEKARVYLEAFQRVQANSPVSKLLARVYLADGNAALAVSVLESYLRSQPGDGQALTLLAAAHMALGRSSKAASLMQQALKAKDDPAFRTALGLSLVGAGQSLDGIAELETAFKKDPQRPDAPTALVQLYLRGAQGRKALPVAEHLIKLQPQNAAFHNFLGMAHAQMGNAKSARAAFEKALALDSKIVAAKINLARVEISNKDYDSATKRLHELLRLTPNDSEAFNELSVIAERKGQLQEARRWLEKARDFGGAQEVRWDLELVEFHFRNGSPSLALEAAKLASAKAPDDLRALMAYSRAQIANGDLASAKSTLNAATRFAEYNAPRQVDVARLQIAARNLPGAAYSLDKAISGDPNYLPAHALLTEVELRQGESAKAEKRARELVARYPQAAIGHNLMGDIALAKGDINVAVNAYSRAHAIAPQSLTLLRLFRALSAVDGGKPAFQLATQWLKNHPDDLPVHKAVGNSHARAGNYAAAKTSYEAVIKRKPDDVEALNNLANVQIHLNDPAAVQTAELALSHGPGNAIVIDTLGWALFKNGKVDKALLTLRDARLRQPANPEIRYHLAVALAQAGRKSEAREELDVALKSEQLFESRQEARSLRLKMQ